MTLPIRALDLSDCDDDDPMLAECVAELANRLEAGEPLDLEDYVQEHPQYAAQLRQLLPAVALMANLGSMAGRTITHAPGSALSPGRDPVAEAGVLGDYRILREIGRGGMGIVYEAQQLSLDRRVALKILPFASALDPKQLQRFQLEAQAAAQLHHVHIVPVYAVGCELGVPYYAMQYVAGRTLADVVHELRLAEKPAVDSTTAKSVSVTCRSTCPRDVFRDVAYLGLQAAEALEHAHQWGVIHRDIKPANLLVEASGHLWVTDFGLARVRGDSNLTMTGDLIGTLRYMSPEQAMGRRVVIDHRTDIYSLGATLYELLTLRPAFAGRDRQELLRQIAQEEPRPPRKVNPAVPTDLETIVLKAMAKEPGGRYASAQEMADDLRRFLADEPIRARRPSARERLAKWMRRHKPIVGAVMVVILLALVGSAASAVLIYREKNRTEANLGLALKVLDDVYAQIADKAFPLDPRHKEGYLSLLRQTLDFHEQIAQRNGGDPSVRWHTAHAYGRVGDIRLRLGYQEEAEAAYRRAVALLEALVADEPREPSYRLGLARGLNDLGSLLAERLKFPEAEPLLRQALAIQQVIAAAGPITPELRRELAHSWNHLGKLLAGTGRSQEAEAALRRALDLRQALAAENPARPEARQELSISYGQLGYLLATTGRTREAQDALDQALMLQRTLVDEYPAFAEFRRDLARTHDLLGNLLATTHRPEDAAAALRDAQRLQKTLVDDFPTVPEYSQDWARTENLLGIVLTDLRQYEEAEDCFRQALDLLAGLRAEFPKTPEYTRDLANTHDSLSVLLTLLGRTREARDAAEESLVLRKGLGEEPSPSLTYRCEMVSYNCTVAYLMQATDHPEDAERFFRQALEFDPENPTVRNSLAWVLATCPGARAHDPEEAIRLARDAVARAPKAWAFWNTLGAAYLGAGDWKAARQALEQSMALRGGGDSYDWFFLAQVDWHQGNHAQAHRWYAQALDWMRQHKPNDAELLRLGHQAAAVLGLSPGRTAPGEELRPIRGSF